jgi:DNA primase
VEGPTQLFLTTTASQLDDELLNRCLVLTVDEDKSQTQAIHELQRNAQTLEGLLQKQDKHAILKLHQNAQRLLRPLAVVNPFAKQLTFPSSQTRMRRDFPKYLTLMKAIALLHQYQREVKVTQRNGASIEYIEVNLADIALANRLAAAVLGRSMDELPPQTRRLLEQLSEFTKRKAEKEKLLPVEIKFTRREIREAYGWSNTQLALQMGFLTEFEFVRARRDSRNTQVYSMNEDTLGRPKLDGLLEVN